MGVLETAARIIQLGGEARGGRIARVVEMRAAFEATTGAFSIEDAWFEERSRAFWCDALTRGRFGRNVENELSPEDRRWLGPLERAHRGLFRRGAGQAAHPQAEVLVDVWSGAEMWVTTLDEGSRADLETAGDQLLDGRVVGDWRVDEPVEVALLPGAIFHPSQATAAIGDVIAAARSAGLKTDDVLDALLRMERSLRALSRVKANYAYRAEALAAATAPGPVRRLPGRRIKGAT